MKSEGRRSKALIAYKPDVLLRANMQCIAVHRHPFAFPHSSNDRFRASLLPSQSRCMVGSKQGRYRYARSSGTSTLSFPDSGVFKGEAAGRQPQLMTLVAKNQGHSAAVTCLAFSPQVSLPARAALLPCACSSAAPHAHARALTRS